jgi:hypothetical protein
VRKKKCVFRTFEFRKTVLFQNLEKKKFDLIFSCIFLNYHSENKVRMIDSFGFRKARDHPTHKHGGWIWVFHLQADGHHLRHFAFDVARLRGNVDCIHVFSFRL